MKKIVYGFLELLAPNTTCPWMFNSRPHPKKIPLARECSQHPAIPQETTTFLILTLASQWMFNTRPHFKSWPSETTVYSASCWFLYVLANYCWGIYVRRSLWLAGRLLLTVLLLLLVVEGSWQWLETRYKTEWCGICPITVHILRWNAYDGNAHIRLNFTNHNGFWFLVKDHFHRTRVSQ